MPKANGKGLAKLSSLVIGLQSHKYDGILMDAATAKAYAANIQIFMPLIRNCQILLAELPWPFLKVIPR